MSFVMRTLIIYHRSAKIQIYSIFSSEKKMSRPNLPKIFPYDLNKVSISTLDTLSTGKLPINTRAFKNLGSSMSVLLLISFAL